MALELPFADDASYVVAWRVARVLRGVKGAGEDVDGRVASVVSVVVVEQQELQGVCNYST